MQGVDAEGWNSFDDSSPALFGGSSVGFCRTGLVAGWMTCEAWSSSPSI